MCSVLDTPRNTSESDGRRRRWDAHKTARRADFLEAAVATIEQRGPHVGVKQVAEHAGLPRPVLYRHFRDRQDLDEQIRETIVGRLMAELVPILVPDGTPRQTIRNAVSTYLGWIDRNPRLHQFLSTGRTHDPGSRVIVNTKTAIAGHLAELLVRVLRSYDARTDIAEPLAFAVVGLVDSAVNRWLSTTDPQWSAGELADFLSTSIWNLVEGQLRGLGMVVDPDTAFAELTV